MIDTHPNPNLFDYSDVIVMLEAAAATIDDERVNNTIDLFKSIRNLPVGCYDLQSNPVCVINRGRFMAEAPYSISSEKGTFRVHQQIDFVPIFTVVSGTTNQTYVLVHSKLTTARMKEYMNQYLQYISPGYGVLP